MEKYGKCDAIRDFLIKSIACVRGEQSTYSESESEFESYYYCDEDTLRIQDHFSSLSEDSSDLSTKRAFQILVTQAIVNDISRHRDCNRCIGPFLTLNRRHHRPFLIRSLSKGIDVDDDLFCGDVQYILNRSLQWKFNAFTLKDAAGGNCLPLLSIHLFHSYGLIKHFNLDVIRLCELFRLIDLGYVSDNPYHNSVHATDVMQAMHCFLQQDKIYTYMEPLEIMASLIGAMAHDIDHPGVNQNFLIATSNYKTKLYGNSSVLENHHFRAAISCVINSGVIESLELRNKLTKQISSLILATDITKQHEYLSKFKMYLDTNTLDMTNSEHRHLVLQIALKCADISNPCRPWAISQKWSFKVCQEFFQQGDSERKLNLPITPLCDRHTTSIPKIQTDFFKFVVTPLMVQWHRFLQNDLSRQMLDNLNYNTERWEAMLDQELTQNIKIEMNKDDFNDNTKLWTHDDNATTSKRLSEFQKCPLNSAKPTGLKKKLCRLSGSVTCQDFRFWHRDQPSSSDSGSKADEEEIMGDDEQQKLLTSEEPQPDTSIASVPTPEHEAVGTQLYKNMLQLNTDNQMGRRKSMPTESVQYSPMEKKLREVAASIPQLLLRTLYGKETCSRRRGSAPAPLAQSEFKGPASSGGLRHSVNGGLRKQSPLVACHQWISSRSQHGPRRGSLPAEVFQYTEEKDDGDQ